MPYKCSAWGCSNTPNLDRGIGLHVFPSESDLRPEVQRRRKIWVDFVKTRRAKWEPTANARLCSVHFEAECFQRRFTLMPSEGIAGRPTLIRDDFGVSFFCRSHSQWPRLQANGSEPRMISDTLWWILLIKFSFYMFSLQAATTSL